MADATLSSISNALEQRFRALVKQQPNRSTVLLNLLEKRPGSGKNVAGDVSVGTSVGQVFDDGEDVAVYNNDTELPSTLAWAEYGDAFAITGKAEDAAANDNTQLARLYVHKLGQARTRAAAKINTDLYTGAGTSGPQLIHGLTATAGPLDSTGTYAGIDRGTYSQWASNEIDAAGASISTSVINRGFEATYLASGMQPTFMVTHPTQWNRYADTLDEKRRINQATVRGQMISLDGGYQMLEVNGVPLIMDKDCPNDTVVGIYDPAMWIEFLPVAPARQGRILAMNLPIAGTPQEQAGDTDRGMPLMAYLLELARSGNKSKFQLLTTVQLVTDQCNVHFKITGLATT